MELLLNETIPSLGRVGDVVKVKPGYARNYLLPRGLAVPVTKANLIEIEKARAAALLEEAKRVDDIQVLAKAIADTSVTIEGRANEENHLFGSVTAAQVAEALVEKGFAVEERHVRLDTPIKEIGTFDVAIHLHPEVGDVNIKLWVVPTGPRS